MKILGKQLAIVAVSEGSGRGSQGLSIDAATRTKVAGFGRFQFISSNFLKREHDTRERSSPKESRAGLIYGLCQSERLSQD